MTDQQTLILARERFNRFHKILFFSGLTMVQTTMYDCEPDLNATMAEKHKLSMAMTLLEIEREIADVERRSWFSKRKVRNLLREKDALISLNR